MAKEKATPKSKEEKPAATPKAKSPAKKSTPKRQPAKATASTTGDNAAKAAPKKSPAKKSTPKKSAPKKQPAKATAKSEPTKDQIAERAYELFLARGGKHGYHMEDWYRAEKELRSGKG
jgi:hypothetical protein